MSEQLTIIDLASDKDKELLTPQVWSCLRTCKNFSNINPDGSRDFFPCSKEPRCINTDFYSKLVNNYWITKCRNYKQ
jgi:hypothetical protein